MFPETLKGVRAEQKALIARLKELELVEDHMMRFQKVPCLEAVIPANNPSQETVKVSGDDLETVVKEVCQEWERKHPKPRAYRSHVHIFLQIGDLSVAVSPKDAPSNVTIEEITEDRSRRYRIVWSKTERGCGALD